MSAYPMVEAQRAARAHGWLPPSGADLAVLALAQVTGWLDVEDLRAPSREECKHRHFLWCAGQGRPFVWVHRSRTWVECYPTIPPDARERCIAYLGAEGLDYRDAAGEGSAFTLCVPRQDGRRHVEGLFGAFFNRGTPTTVPG